MTSTLTTEALSEVQVSALKTFFGNRPSMFKTLFRVVDKNRSMVPFVLQPAQSHYYAARSEADVILKSRQLGFSTLIEADFLLDAILIPNLMVTLFVQNEEAIPKFMGIFHRDKIENGLYDLLPEKIEVSGVKINLKPELTIANTSTLMFSNGSTINVMTSGGERLGAGRTIHRAHFTEVGLWDKRVAETIIATVMGAMPPTGSKAVIESTARGQEGAFWDIWNAAKAGASVFKPHFYDWTWGPDYWLPKDTDKIPMGARDALPSLEEQEIMTTLHLSPEQVLYRRMNELIYKERRAQEFPDNEEEAFLATGSSIFTMREVALAKRFTSKAPYGSDQLSIWKEPEAELKYLVVIDSSQGVTEASDFDVISVLSLSPPYVEHIATWRGRAPQYEVAKKAVELAEHFNGAYICPEVVDGSGQVIAEYLTEILKYARVWSRDDGGYGWKTTKFNKPGMIDSFKKLLDSDLFRTYDERVAREMSSYTEHKLPSGAVRIGAANGAYDDLLITLMIGAAVIPMMSRTRARVTHYGRKAWR